MDSNMFYFIGKLKLRAALAIDKNICKMIYKLTKTTENTFTKKYFSDFFLTFPKV